MCAVMIERAPALIAAANGGRFPCAERLQGVVHGGQLQVRVGRRRAVPGEMFGAGGDAGRLQAGHGGGGVRRDPGRVGAEASRTDDRVVGSGVDVHARGQVQVDADGGQVEADAVVELAGERGVVDHAERGVAG